MLRRIDDLPPDQEPQTGCPMLTRTKLGLPTHGGYTVPRCSLAWALHNEHEATMCMLTPDLTDCWKVHPERKAAVEELIATETVVEDQALA